MFKCNIKEPEPQIIIRYIGGLKESIADVIRLQPYWTFNDVCKLAYNVEKQQLKESKKLTPTLRRPNFANQGSSSSNTKTSIKGNLSTSSSNSKVDEKIFSKDASKKRCFKCQGIGHLQVYCPNRKAIMYISDQLIELENDNEEPKDNYQGEDDVEEGVEPDQGKLLVIQQSLHADLEKEEPWQGDALFHIRCASHGKVCLVIVDSGSCTNAVSEEMVTKLGLKTKRHPKQYNNRWLQDGGGMKITKC